MISTPSIKSSKLKKYLILTIILVASFAIAGCSLNVKPKEAPPSAGIYKSADKGNTWKKKNNFISAKGTGNMAEVSIVDFIFDPSDNKAIYLISSGDGLFYTYDGGDSWMQPARFSKGTITDLAVDPHDKCTIYVSYGIEIFKSIDCNRTYETIYTDSRPGKKVTALALDSFNAGIIYAGTAEGEILKSFDSGISWTTIKRINSQIVKLLVDPRDTRIIYVATTKKALYKSSNSGDSWKSLNDGLKKFSSYKNFRDLVFMPSQPDSLLLLTRYGLIKTIDGGDNWEAIDLITPPLGADIKAIAVSPQSTQEIYYGTPTTFYKTVDGGDNWITSKLPSNSPSSKIVIDPNNPDIIYLGLKIIKKK